MTKIINIKDKETSIKGLSDFKVKDYDPLEVEITNIHLTRLNKFCKTKVFKNNKLYISSSTLFDAMQPVGKRGHHHYHGLTEEEIIYSLASINTQDTVYQVGVDRFLIATSIIAKCGDIIIVLIDIDAALHNDCKAKINKIVTLYPKENCKKYLKKVKKV